jgi:arsenite-transporting ATPase
MIDALLARASTRFVFIAGKGGVGKTTTAGGLALALADQGADTHLISTDPAHSIGDLFQQDLTNGRGAASGCNDRLLLEEFAARRYADALFQELREPLIALIERGTYLDESDAASFLDLSIPGIDEVMSALRLVDLHDATTERVVVDTAPTGHTLRLLDAASVIESWVAAARAMAEKAGVVATYLVGAPVRLAAEPLLHDLQRKARSFTGDVLRHASVVVVTRSGTIVTAETSRLIDDLKSRGLTIAAEIRVARPEKEKEKDEEEEEKMDGSHFTAEWYASLHGCAGLRAWSSHLRAPQPAPASPPTPAPAARPAPAPSPAEGYVRALGAKLIMIAGKGGVGKSTCAAAIATTLADTRRACLVSTDPAGSLSEILALPIGQSPIEVTPKLFGWQINATADFQRMRDEYRASVNQVFESIGLETAAQLDRKVVESLWDFAPPGIDEIIALVEILNRADEFDTIIVDAAPTGHFLRLIELPEIALNWIHALLRLLVKYGALASLDALARDLLGFSKRLRQLKLDLSTQGTSAVFVVTLDSPMVSAETARLSAALERAGVPIAATILNRSADGGAPPGISGHRWIRAPDLGREAIGQAALRSFLAQWSINGE